MDNGQEDRERLKEVLGTKITTTMMYSIDQIEQAFGFLWGHATNEPLTDEEISNKEIWRQVRKNIMDMGNKQKRNAFAEIDTHSVTRKLFRTEFTMSNRGNSNGQ